MLRVHAASVAVADSRARRRAWLGEHRRIAAKLLGEPYAKALPDARPALLLFVPTSISLLTRSRARCFTTMRPRFTGRAKQFDRWGNPSRSQARARNGSRQELLIRRSQGRARVGESPNQTVTALSSDLGV